MRILQVRFKNLNSLVGEWAIDLTHPSYVADGIFAITGPTGAGKTTILDAICLALYGRTPRLNKLTRSTNEIMSRQTGECFAEVTFATPTGRFSCHWSQHRARKKPDGELQAPKHEIADSATGALVETKLRGVAEQIEAVTGMDFGRFTRSMLLAQGDFAAFLQAVPDERAPILEQITGTEVYSRISIGVHERRSEEHKKLEAMQAELDGIQLLGEEERQRLRTELAEQQKRDTALGEQLAGKKLRIGWLDTIAALEQELQQVHQRRQELHDRQRDFAPEQQKLQQAVKALELIGDYQVLLSIRREQQSERQNLETALKQLPQLEKTAKQAGDALTAALERLRADKAEQQRLAPLIRNVRELDLRLREKDGPIKTAAAAVTALERSRAALSAACDGNRKELAHKRTIAAGLQKQLEQTAADEELVAQYTGMLGRFSTLRDLRGQLLEKAEEIKQAEKQLAEAGRYWKKQVGTLARRQRQVAKTQTGLAGKQREFKTILADQELSHWRLVLSSLTERQARVAEIAEAVGSLERSKQSVTQLDRDRVVTEREEKKLTTQLASHLEKQRSLEQQLDELETRFSQLKQVEDLDTYRQHLQDGEPCPLCGAHIHPFSRETPPVPDETRRQRDAIRVELKAAADSIGQVRVKLAEVGKDRQHTLARRQELSDQVNAAHRLVKEAGAEFLLAADDPDLGEKVAGLASEQARKREQAITVVTAAEAVDKELADLRQVLEKEREMLARAEREAQAAQYKLEGAEHQLARLTGERQRLQHRCDETLDRTKQELTRYRVEVTLDQLDQIQEQLRSRRESWLAHQKEAAELARMIGVLEVRIDQQSKQLKEVDGELSAKRRQLNELSRQREELLRQRRELFADKTPDDEEQRLAKGVEAADKSVEAARRQMDGADRELGALRAGIVTLEKSLATRERQLQEAQAAFPIRLATVGFTDEVAFTKACLPEDERKALAERAQRLADENTALTAREREVTALLAAERQRDLGNQGREALCRAVDELVAAQKEIQRQIGALSQKLHDNDTLMKKRSDRIEAVAAQQRECLRWDELHLLIGSADGKKYRNFAQGLTFEMMIGHANRQLRKMTDRYLLVRDGKHPLELNVIDNYQAGEVRSTKNLSGGEGFLVSLALALGLSQMASRKVRVDSLFLDEGFGTLDDEALDTALETLAGLQQDGKVIGVISHVPALKERIATRIQVIPETGGRSRIVGPGCRHGEMRPEKLDDLSNRDMCHL